MFTLKIELLEEIKYNLSELNFFIKKLSNINNNTSIILECGNNIKLMRDCEKVLNTHRSVIKCVTDYNDYAWFVIKSVNNFNKLEPYDSRFVYLHNNTINSVVSGIKQYIRMSTNVKQIKM